MKITTITEPNKCPWWHKVFWHNWEYEDGNGFTSYYICRCGARMAKQREGERQPVDWNWVLGKTQKVDIKEVVLDLRPEHQFIAVNGKKG